MTTFARSRSSRRAATRPTENRCGLEGRAAGPCKHTEARLPEGRRASVSRWSVVDDLKMIRPGVLAEGAAVVAGDRLVAEGRLGGRHRGAGSTTRGSGRWATSARCRPGAPQKSVRSSGEGRGRAGLVMSGVLLRGKCLTRDAGVGDAGQGIAGVGQRTYGRRYTPHIHADRGGVMSEKQIEAVGEPVIEPKQLPPEMEAGQVNAPVLESAPIGQGRRRGRVSQR